MYPKLWLHGRLGAEARKAARMLCLMASATLVSGIILAENLHDWGRRAVTLFNYTHPGI